jgi:alpha(1,3/1,4) fucosyltransferase
MMPLRVAFMNFWDGFDPRCNHFLTLLARRFPVQVIEEPDRAAVVFESYFRPPGVPPPGPPRDDQVAIFFSGEAHNLPIGRHHAVISMNLLRTPNHCRYPIWMLNFQPIGEAANCEQQRYGRNVTYDLIQRPLGGDPRPGFACAIFNNKSHLRYEAMRQLAAYGQVDAYGRHFGRSAYPKYDVLVQYRMNVCFENTVQPGYVTEKVVEARAAGCMPLWWGDPTYRLDFHERALVNLYEYDLDFARVFDEVDMKELASTPLLKRHPDEYNAELEDFLYRIVSTPPSRLFLADAVTTEYATALAPKG